MIQVSSMKWLPLSSLIMLIFWFLLANGTFDWKSVPPQHVIVKKVNRHWGFHSPISSWGLPWSTYNSIKCFMCSLCPLYYLEYMIARKFYVGKFLHCFRGRLQNPRVNMVTWFLTGFWWRSCNWKVIMIVFRNVSVVIVKLRPYI